jgi:hypothetical protein
VNVIPDGDYYFIIYKYRSNTTENYVMFEPTVPPVVLYYLILYIPILIYCYINNKRIQDSDVRLYRTVGMC